MSYIRVNISDKDGAMSGDVHGSMTQTLMAALTAEPETIDEYSTAFDRYLKFETDFKLLDSFRRHEDLEPYDAGIIAIDLAGRTVGHDTTYTYPEPSGDVKIPNEFADESDEDIYIPYQLPDDWKFVRGIPEFEGARHRNRELRAKNMPFDARPILYGRPLILYIARSVALADDPDAEDLFTEIHVRWLTEPQDALRGKTPREILLDRRDFISFDLHTRFLQYSITKVCPKPLDTKTFAYINAGFGTHEIVVYYDMFRYLLEHCMRRREKGFDVQQEEEISKLREIRDTWLREQNGEFRGFSPLEVIELERRRLNMTMSAKDALIDEDCPCCVAMSEDFDTPMFWFLDGCNMDDRYEFSFHKTRDEWEAEQRSYEEIGRQIRNESSGNQLLEDEDAPF